MTTGVSFVSVLLPCCVCPDAAHVNKSVVVKASRMAYLTIVVAWLSISSLARMALLLTS